MNEELLANKDTAKELILVKQLLSECKLDQADQLIKKFEEKEGHTLHDLVLGHLLNCELLFLRGLHQDVVKLADQAYKESLKLGKILILVDILLIKAHSLVYHKQSDNLLATIKQGEELLKSLPQELPAEYKEREAYIAYLKGWYYIFIDEAEQALKNFEYSLELREELYAKKEMALSLIGIAWVFLFLKLDSERAIKFSEKAMIAAEESGNKWILANCLNNMAIEHIFKRELDRAFILAEQGMRIFNDLNNEFRKALMLTNMGGAYLQRGEIDRALKTVELGMTIAKESGIKWVIGFCFISMAQIHIFKGDLDRGIMLYEQSLTIFNDLNIKRWVGNILNNLGEAYRQKGELDRALECLEQGLALYDASGNLKRIASYYDYLIQILIERGDLEKAQKFLQRYEQLNTQLKDKHHNLIYQLDKALLLKTSNRARNRAKAEEILNQILEDEDSDFELMLKALTNLCELLITELRMTNDLEVLEEINPLIDRLSDIAEKTGSYSILCESYIFQAKLSLLTFNIKKAQQFLIKSQELAERFGLKLLAIKISEEHDELLKQLTLWENLKDSNSSLKERMEFAQLNDQMENMIRQRVSEQPNLSDEDPVLLLVVSEGGIPIFSQLFVKDQSFEEHLFGGFFTAINSFIKEKFSERLDRATFGEHTLLMSSVSPFFMCYVFKGQSYQAQQRIRYFIDKIQNDEEIWQKFKKFYQLNQEIQLKDIPSLEPLITKIFIDKSVTFIT